MKKIVFCFVLALVSITVIASPLCRVPAAALYDDSVGWLASIAGLVSDSVSPKAAELDHAETTLKKDRESLNSHRVALREQIRFAKEKQSDQKRSMKAAEENAIRFRDALTKAQMNDDDEIVIDRRFVFSQNELSAQIGSLLNEYDSLRKNCESYSELLDEAVERELELMETLTSIDNALDRIPLQRALVLSNSTTERTAETIADVTNIHQKVQTILRVEKLMTAAEIEEQRKAAPENPGNTERLQAFLDGENVFASEM